MQDHTKQTGHTIRESGSVDTAGEFAPQLFDKILASDVVILVSSSEAADQALTVQHVYAAGASQPEHVASHAYAHAVQLAHGDLLRTVRGEPTDAQRYRAFRDFATMAEVKSPRYDQVNTMLMEFEAAHLDPSQKGTPGYMDTVSDFLVHALAETEPTLEAPTTAPAIALS